MSLLPSSKLNSRGLLPSAARRAPSCVADLYIMVNSAFLPFYFLNNYIIVCVFASIFLICHAGGNFLFVNFNFFRCRQIILLGTFNLCRYNYLNYYYQRLFVKIGRIKKKCLALSFIFYFGILDFFLSSTVSHGNQ